VTFALSSQHKLPGCIHDLKEPLAVLAGYLLFTSLKLNNSIFQTLSEFRFEKICYSHVGDPEIILKSGPFFKFLSDQFLNDVVGFEKSQNLLNNLIIPISILSQLRSVSFKPECVFINFWLGIQKFEYQFLVLLPGCVLWPRPHTPSILKNFLN